jgi:hypothetical protein
MDNERVVVNVSGKNALQLLILANL